MMPLVSLKVKLIWNYPPFDCNWNVNNMEIIKNDKIRHYISNRYIKVFLCQVVSKSCRVPIFGSLTRLRVNAASQKFNQKSGFSSKYWSSEAMCIDLKAIFPATNASLSSLSRTFWKEQNSPRYHFIQ